MNDRPAPLSRDETLELLSAELDGEFDAAAAGLGLAPDVARARLEATAGVDEDWRALAEAAGATVAPLDDATRDALVARALEHTPSDELSARRASRWNAKLILGAAAGLAAVVLAFSAIAMNERDDDGDASLTADAATESDADDGGDDSAAADESAGSAGDMAESEAPAAVAGPEGLRYAPFGDVTDPDVLREQALALYNQPPASYDAELLSGFTPDSCTNCARTIYDDLVDNSPLDCPLPDDAIGPLVISGDGTYDGIAVRVLGYSDGTELQVFVIDAECNVLDQQFMTP